MPKRTDRRDAKHIEVADDVDEFVVDKREGWRATAAKARRRQRRYAKQMTDELVRLSQEASGDDAYR